MARRKETPHSAGHDAKSAKALPKATGTELIPMGVRERSSRATAPTGAAEASHRKATDFEVPSANHNLKPALSTGFDSLLDAVRTGLPFATLERLGELMDVNQGQLAALLGIPARTIARRKHDGRLTPSESDRVDRTERTFRLAAEVLEGEGKAREWLHRPNRGLGGETPLSLLDTDRGVRAVEDILMRIEHGMYG